MRCFFDSTTWISSRILTHTWQHLSCEERFAGICNFCWLAGKLHSVITLLAIYRVHPNYSFFLLQIEKIHNPLLESAFQRVKRKIEGRNTGMPVCHRLYHHVPAQYCSLVCKTGFQKTYSSQGKPDMLL